MYKVRITPYSQMTTGSATHKKDLDDVIPSSFLGSTLTIPTSLSSEQFLSKDDSDSESITTASLDFFL